MNSSSGVREPTFTSAPPLPVLTAVTYQQADVQLGSRRLQPVPNWAVRIPALDGLRGIAILMVLMRHSVFGMQTQSRALSAFLVAGQLTWSGVDLFFVLSGFLIGGILLDARQSPRLFRTFYIRRAYRILPVYFAVTFLFLFHHLPFRLLPGTFGHFSALSVPWGAYFTFTQNFWMVGLGWFGPVAMQATWSLAVEEQFYLTIPLVIRKIRGRHLVVCLLAVVVAAPLLRIVVLHRLTYGSFADYVLMPCRADSLCLGVLAACLVRTRSGWNALLAHRKLLCLFVWILLGGVGVMTWLRWDAFCPPMVVVGYSWLALLYTCCLLIVISGNGWIVRNILRSRTLMNVGMIAYCTYLVHLAGIQAGRRVFDLIWPGHAASSWLLGGMAGVTASLVIAALSWRFFEKPLLRRAHCFVY